MLPKLIDLCIALNGPHVGVMLPFFWHSLHHVCGTEIQNFRIHFVDRGCSEPVKEWLASKAGAGVVIHQLYDTFGEMNQTQRNPFPSILADCARTCTWMLDNCGDCEWCIISHFDIAFREDLLNRYRIAMQKDYIGQLGSHSSGVVCYRREAVRQCSVGFDAVSGFSLARDYDRNVDVIRHYSDSRGGQTTPIHGFDIGELLELNLAAKGWEIFSESHAVLNTWRYHLGTGSGHCGDQPQKRAEALAILEARKLIPIE